MTNLTTARVPLQQVVKRPVDYHQDYSESFLFQVAVLMINDKVGGLGFVHAFREMGIPFFVTTGYTSDGASKVLARFENGSAALLKKSAGQGALLS